MIWAAGFCANFLRVARRASYDASELLRDLCRVKTDVGSATCCPMMSRISGGSERSRNGLTNCSGARGHPLDIPRKNSLQICSANCFLASSPLSSVPSNGNIHRAWPGTFGDSKEAATWVGCQTPYVSGYFPCDGDSASENVEHPNGV